MPTPYAEHVGDADPVDILERSLADYADLGAHLTPERWSQPWAPGKWTVAQVVVHVAQWELIFGVRLRCGVCVKNYLVQPLNQDDFMREAGPVDGPTGLATFLALRRMTIAFARSLSPDDRARRVQHAERGAIDVEDILVTLAGHGVHHWKQIRA